MYACSLSSPSWPRSARSVPWPRATAWTRAATTAASSSPGTAPDAGSPHRRRAQRRLRCGPCPSRSRPPCCRNSRARARAGRGEGWAYEPKSDGFRAIAFVNGEEVRLQSRNGRAADPLLPGAEFPDGPLRPRQRDRHPRRVGRQDFDARPAHPPGRVARRRGSRRRRPRAFIAFDLLAHDDDVLIELPLRRVARGAGGPRRGRRSRLTPMVRTHRGGRALAARTPRA